MVNRRGWQVVVCVSFLMLLASSSGAQSPATSFDELRRLLIPGQEVILTRADGRQSRERVLSVTESALDVQSKSMFRFRAPGPRMSLAESAVTRVTRVDSLWHGALIGYAAGLGLGIAACQANEGDCVPVAAVLFPTMLGGLVGASIDAVIRKTVYLNGTRRAAGQAMFTVAPVIDMKTTGASSLRF
jgi:hypothetical protein